MESVPGWVLVGVATLLTPVAAFAMAWATVRLNSRSAGLARLGGAWVEVAVRERQMPRGADLVVAPVATDLRMAAGIAKWVRDATANAAQKAADAVGSAARGTAILAPGGRYRFRNAALAVVLDEAKRFSVADVQSALEAGLRVGREAGARTAVLPDFVDDLMRQSQVVTLEERRNLARLLAPAVVAAAAGAGALGYTSVTLWVYRSGVEDIYAEALLAAEATALTATA